MLGNILRIINRDGYISRAMLAGELNIPEEIINEGINQLLRMGYIFQEETGQDCATFCVKCSFAKNCNKEIIKTFAISNKGSSYLG